MNEELLDLLDRYRDGTLREEDIIQLRELLKRDAAVRQDFVRERMIEAACELETGGSAPRSQASPSLFKLPKSRLRIRWEWAAAAAVVLFGIGLGSGLRFFNPDPEVTGGEQVDDGIAFLSDSVDAVWGNNLDPGEGGILSPGQLKLISGLAQIEFYSGARLVLEGPVDLELISTNSAICREGKLRAMVPPHARGFTVHSPQFELVDLGTEFGVEVNRSGESTVHVFDGEVELYPPDGKRSVDQLKRLNKGAGLSFATNGETAAASGSPEGFPSFGHIEERTREAREQRFGNWKEWNQSVGTDDRIVAHYDFENGEGSRLIDRGPAGANGTIIGSEWNRGRWPGKGALEFKRPGDRVRLDIPGEFDALTLSAWIRMDAQTGRMQSLLLTDSYEVGRVHWQIAKDGSLRFGTRLPSGVRTVSGSGYGSPVLFNPRRIGTWNSVTTVYDRSSGEVCHFLNGREVSREKIKYDQALRIGPAEIGNWGVPFRPKTNSHVVRNFVGRIDEMTLWKVALTSEEIREIYLRTRP